MKNKQWWIVFSIALPAFLWGLGCMVYTVTTGIGTWGLNKTVGWAWISPISFGGLVSVTPELLSLPYYYYSVKNGEWRLTVLQKQ